MVRIDSAGVVGDNMWLWRADHVEGGGLVKNGDNPCDNALVVNGDDVHMYGLAAEHTLKDIVQWNGERGASFFFQAELPYDVKSYPYAGYAVAASVQAHQSYGAGVYHYFRDYQVTVQSGITCPAALEASFVSPLAVYLNGNGTMQHILNDRGNATKKPAGPGADPAWICAAAAPNPSSWARADPASCKVGDNVPCPGGGPAMCAGNECCPGGITCPSADPRFQCCPKPKTVDCTKPGPAPTPPPSPGPAPPPGPPPPSPGPVPPPGPPPPPTPGPHCKVDAVVDCPGTTDQCAGPQCCPDGSTCPSAPDTFHGCPHPKKVDCTKQL